MSRCGRAEAKLGFAERDKRIKFQYMKVLIKDEKRNRATKDRVFY